MLKALKGAAVGCVALLVTSTIIYAAGNWSTLPIVGSASYCASTVTGTGSLGGITGQGQGTTGSICAQTVPAGPSIVTGNEVVPVDFWNPATITSSQGGTPPATGLLSLASLNSLPIFLTSVISQTTTTFTSTNLMGGVMLISTGTMTAVTVKLPPAPIDGQQFTISGNQTVTALTVTATSPQLINQNPTIMTASTTVPYGYRFVYNLASLTWNRLQ
jgi:hypothetical protein